VNSGKVPLKSILNLWINDEHMFEQIVRVNEQIVIPKIRDSLVISAQGNGQPPSVYMRDDGASVPSEYRDMWDGSAWMKTISRNLCFWIDDYVRKFLKSISFIHSFILSFFFIIVLVYLLLHGLFLHYGCG